MPCWEAWTYSWTEPLKVGKEQGGRKGTMQEAKKVKEGGCSEHRRSADSGPASETLTRWVSAVSLQEVSHRWIWFWPGLRSTVGDAAVVITVDRTSGLEGGDGRGPDNEVEKGHHYTGPPGSYEVRTLPAIWVVLKHSQVTTEMATWMLLCLLLQDHCWGNCMLWSCKVPSLWTIQL